MVCCLHMCEVCLQGVEHVRRASHPVLGGHRCKSERCSHVMARLDYCPRASEVPMSVSLPSVHLAPSQAENLATMRAWHESSPKRVKNLRVRCSIELLHTVIANATRLKRLDQVGFALLEIKETRSGIRISFQIWHDEAQCVTDQIIANVSEPTRNVLFLVLQRENSKSFARLVRSEDVSPLRGRSEPSTTRPIKYVDVPLL